MNVLQTIISPITSTNTGTSLTWSKVCFHIEGYAPLSKLETQICRRSDFVVNRNDANLLSDLLVTQFVRLSASPSITLHVSPIEAEISACINSPPTSSILSNDSDVLLTSTTGMSTLSINPPYTLLPSVLRVPLNNEGKGAWRSGIVAMFLGCDYVPPQIDLVKAVDLARRIVDGLSKDNVRLPQQGGRNKQTQIVIKNEWEGAGVGRKRGVQRCGYVVAMVNAFQDIRTLVKWLVQVKEEADKSKGKKRKRKGKGKREDVEREWNKEWGERVEKAAEFYTRIYQGLEGVWASRWKASSSCGSLDYFCSIHGLTRGDEVVNVGPLGRARYQGVVVLPVPERGEGKAARDIHDVEDMRGIRRRVYDVVCGGGKEVREYSGKGERVVETKCWGGGEDPLGYVLGQGTVVGEGGFVGEVRRFLESNGKIGAVGIIDELGERCDREKTVGGGLTAKERDDALAWIEVVGWNVSSAMLACGVEVDIGRIGELYRR
ncbi:hypothetical protein TrCOL_g6084 [Triparma columacea]|uniref:Uncharacterized protein n=1 Tax=Triparma columacea TaxID=722753 RepID=A0A9W7FYH9_9STRA|nr:hypothetical protein TrCOL_g6084 [Triparma columacea]